MGIKVLNYFPTEAVLDDENGVEQRVKLRVKRLTVGEHAKFKADYNRCGEPPSNKFLARKGEGDEQEKTEGGSFVVSDADVAERRLAEMDEDTLARYRKMDAEDEEHAQTFLKSAIVDYVTVPDGEIEGPDGTGVTTGAQLWGLYVGRPDVIQQLVRLVWTENSLSAAAKKALRSLSDFQHSLNAQALAQVGERPAATAGNAEEAASAVTAGATESTAARFGSEGRS